MTRDVTTFVGIVVTGVLDAQLLQRKTVELIARWPALGGKIITKVLRLECHRFISGCTDPFLGSLLLYDGFYCGLQISKLRLITPRDFSH